METQKTWLEVSLNGPWGKSRQPGIPIGINEIIAQGVACVEAGAGIVHVQAYDESTGRPHEDAEVYAAVIQGIRSQVDAIVYPAVSATGIASSLAGATSQVRFAIQEELAKRSLLEWSVVDPGSANFAYYDDVKEDLVASWVYANSEEQLRHTLKLAARHRFHPSYGIYEPGFARLGAALHWRSSSPAPIYRFMFSSDYTFGFAPEDYGLTAYLNLLDQVAPGARWMVAGLGVNILPLVPRAVAEGGHVRVGLEDASFGCAKSNLQLVMEAVEVIRNCGAEPATAAEIRAELATVEMGDG